MICYAIVLKHLYKQKSQSFTNKTSVDEHKHVLGHGHEHGQGHGHGHVMDTGTGDCTGINLDTQMGTDMGTGTRHGHVLQRVYTGHGYIQMQTWAFL